MSFLLLLISGCSCSSLVLDFIKCGFSLFTSACWTGFRKNSSAPSSKHLIQTDKKSCYSQFWNLVTLCEFDIFVFMKCSLVKIWWTPFFIWWQMIVVIWDISVVEMSGFIIMPNIEFLLKINKNLMNPFFFIWWQIIVVI